MESLDDVNSVKEYDPSQALHSIRMFPDQGDKAWEDLGQLVFPEHYKEANHVVLCGMGGSALNMDFLQHVYRDRLTIPITICRDYKLPLFVNEKTIVILSSYSGGTEEVLSCAEQAVRKGAKIIGITSGGLLQKFLADKKIPHYHFETEYNPSNQPRLGLGYMVFGLLGMFAKLKFIDLSDEAMELSIQMLKKYQNYFDVHKPFNENVAKRLAKSLKGVVPVIIGAEHTSGVAHTFTNQLHENAKTFASYFLLPELNHHLLEGLKFPEKETQSLVFVFFESDLYSEPIRQRIKATKEVLENQGVHAITYKLSTKNTLDQALEALFFGSFVAFYLALLNETDPSPIPTVDFLKKRLLELRK